MLRPDIYTAENRRNERDKRYPLVSPVRYRNWEGTSYCPVRTLFREGLFVPAFPRESSVPLDYTSSIINQLCSFGTLIIHRVDIIRRFAQATQDFPETNTESLEFITMRQINSLKVETKRKPWRLKWNLILLTNGWRLSSFNMNIHNKSNIIGLKTPIFKS